MRLFILIYISLLVAGCGSDNTTTAPIDTKALEVLKWTANHHIHGDRDSSMPTLQKVALIESGKVVICTCGCISKVSALLMEKNGFKTRQVAGITLDEWNDYDNGHNLFEYYSEVHEKWVLVDVDNNAQPLRNGKPMSVLEMPEALAKKEVSLLKLSNDAAFDPEWEYLDLFKDMKILPWYSRVMQVPLIHKDGFWFFESNPEYDDRLSFRFGYRPISKKEFEKL